MDNPATTPSAGQARYATNELRRLSNGFRFVLPYPPCPLHSPACFNAILSYTPYTPPPTNHGSFPIPEVTAHKISNRPKYEGEKKESIKQQGIAAASCNWVQGHKPSLGRFRTSFRVCVYTLFFVLFLNVVPPL